MTTPSIEIWSDIACPWCWVGKRRFAKAIALVPGSEQWPVRWRSFELDPIAPRVAPAQPYAERLAAKYGSSTAEAQARIDQLVAVAAADGLTLDFTRIRPGNTFDAHRLLQFAFARGRQHELGERLFAAYLREGVAIGEHQELLRLATEVGLDRADVARVLASDAHAADVREDEEQALRFGIRSVPCFVFDRRFAVLGAETPDTLRSALEQARGGVGDAAPAADGGSCGPGGCD